MKAELIVIENREDYAAAKALVSSLMEAASRADGARLRAQAALIAAYEAQVAPPRPADPIEAIRFRMDQMGLKPADLVAIIGSRSKVSEVLRRKRSLSLSMIRRLHQRLGLPAEVLIRAA
jgi:HTH-type transcriptional regulator/antitoxin HigA